MRKAIALILAVFYLTTSSGATIHVHYCMGKLVDWGIGHNDAHSCSNCGMDLKEAGNDCCKDEHKQLKIDDDQKVAQLNFQFTMLAPATIPVFYNGFESSIIPSITENNPLAHAPPRGPQQPIYILHSVFRI